MKRLKHLVVLLFFLTVCMVLVSCGTINEDKEYVRSLYGENRKLESYSGNLGVRCGNGTFVGKKDGDVISWKGIPYAVQPVGEYRWKPVPVAEEDDGIYEAYYFGKSGIQTEADSERSSYYEQGEDCLSLNIWVNSKNSSTGKPVMVFIHGGAYGWGGTSDPLYDGHNLIDKFDDIVLVTINYRIGIMGFIDFSQVEGGEAYAESGNLGLLDQITALTWVQQNISSFGGDPSNVTIFGESAGAGSAALLSIMPQAKGLFSRAIAESGAAALTFSRDEDQALTERLLKETKAKTMADLLSLTEEDLKQANESINDYANYPERDGVVLPENINELYDLSGAADIDLMIGTNADEAHYWIHEVGGYVNYTIGIPILFESNLVQVTDPADQEAIQAFLDLTEGDRTEKYSDFFDEVMFRMPAIRTAESHSAAGGNSYMYYWLYPSALSHMGACHAVELAYVFNNLEETIYTGDNIDLHLAGQVQTMWVNFARTGVPDTEEITWPRYDTAKRATMMLDAKCRIENDPLSVQRKLLFPVTEKYRFSVTIESVNLNVPSVRKYAVIALAALAGFTVLMVLNTKCLKKKIRRYRAKKQHTGGNTGSRYE